MIIIITAHISDIFLAEKVIAEGKADFVAFARSFLADPEFPRKAQEGKIEEIRPCIRCLQGCYDRVFLSQQITCLMNPAVAREKEMQIKPALSKKKIVVVGGGPGGMEAARVLALRGHQVSLYEKENKLGGQFNFASVPPGKQDFARAIPYFSDQLNKLGVKVVLGKEITPEFVLEQKPDAVVIATGAKPIIPEIPGVQGKDVFLANQVLAGEVEVGQKVVVIGGGGIGCETALFLAEQGTMALDNAFFLMTWGALNAEGALARIRKGKKVTLLEMLPTIGRDIGMGRRGYTRRLLINLGVEIITEAEVKEITESGVSFAKGGKTQSAAADTVVIAVGTRSENALYDKLKDKVPELHILGDAKQPRKALDAIHEAAILARQI